MRKFIVLLLLVLLLGSYVYASGTAANTTIIAPSTNIILTYANGAGGSATKNAKVDAIADAKASVLEINGILKAGEVDHFQNAISNGVFKGLIPGKGYSVDISVQNRGNNPAGDPIDITAALTGTAAHWTLSDQPQSTIAEDQLKTLKFWITPNNTTLAFERATVNVAVDLVTPPNVVSYNQFAGAISSSLQNGGYGGAAGFNYSYILEVQGYNLAIAKRLMSVTKPTGYTPALSAGQVVPGSKVKFDIAVSNNSTGIAQGVVLSDHLPANCHLYYNDTPTVVGAKNATWTGSTNNSGSIISWSIDISPNAKVTASYTVTVD